MTAQRITVLDALRGLAAVAVAICHYEMLAGDDPRPLEDLLGFVYEFGRLAVPLFYMLSGYIFFERYAQAIGEKRLSGRDFFYLRASRLYPLHVLTLFAAAGLQILMLWTTEEFFFYSRNDATHFALNLAFLHFSWFDPIMSFNGPSWSLTIEAGLYLVFFALVSRFGAAAGPRLAFCALCMLVSTGRALLPLSGPLNVFFAEGLGCFFIGGCLQLTQGQRDGRKFVLGLAFLALGVGLFWLTDGRRETTPALFAGIVMLALSTPVFRRASETRGLSWLGDISYSVYLWHFPVQVALALASATLLELDFSSPYALALYLTATLALASASQRYFEGPAMLAMRRSAKPPGEGAALAGAN